MKIGMVIPAAVSLLCSTALSAQEAASVAFISCPIFRDTSSVPCWLSESDGQLYYLGIQTDVSAELTPPSLGHKALVEGKLSNDPDICGGKVLKEVSISVLPERAPECNQLLMAEARYELPFTPPRPPGPSTGGLAFDSRGPRPKPPVLTGEQTFVIAYDFEGKVDFSTPRFMSPPLKYAQDTKAKRIEITGYRGAVRLSNGEVVAEREGLAGERAREIESLLKGAGLTSPVYVVKAEEEPRIGGPAERKATIKVIPGN